MLASLEVFRAIAAASIALVHTVGWFAHDAPLAAGLPPPGFLPGSPGVEFFFVLSGFVMWLAHGDDVGRPGALGHFAWRRACRIYPVYWVMAAETIVRMWDTGLITTPRLWQWITLLPRPVEVEILPVAWTLRIEVAFYAVFALMLLPRARYALLPLWLGIVVAASSGWIVLPWWAQILATPFAIQFAAGLVAGVAYRRLRAAPRRLAWALFAAGAAAVVWHYTAFGEGFFYDGLWSRVIRGAGFGAVLTGAALLERRPAGRAARALGALSYPLYVSHAEVLFYLVPALVPLGLAGVIGTWPLTLLILGVLLAAAAVLAYAVDRPVQRALLIRRRDPAAAGPAPPRTAAARAVP